MGVLFGLAASATAQAQHVPTPPKLEYDSVAFGRQLTQWLLYTEIDSLWAQSDTSLQNAYKTKERWLDFTAEPIALRWVPLPGKLTIGYGFNPVSQLPPVDP